MTPIEVAPEDRAFALLDLGYSKEEAAKEAGISVEVLDTLIERDILFLSRRGREDH